MSGRKSNGINDNGKLLRSRYFWLVISVSFAAFMAKLDSYIVNISLPSIAQGFNSTTSEVSWTVIIYLLVSTSLLLLSGRIGDRVGLKKVFIAGYMIFTLGSLLCGVAWSIISLVAFRFLQGVGGAMLLASAYAIITRFLPREIVGWGFGMLGTAVGFGMAVGAPLGGLINDYLSWHWVFLINVPVGIVAIIIARKALPDEKKDDTQAFSFAAIDIPGAVLSFLGLSFLMYAISAGDETGWGSWIIITMFAVSVLLLSAFIFWEKKTKLPLLNFSLLGNGRFMLAVAAAFLAYMTLSGNAFLLPFYLLVGKGMTSEMAGFLIMISSVMLVIVSPAAGRLSDRIRPSLICTVAMASCAASVLVFALALSGGMKIILLFLIWFPASLGMFQAPNNNQVMDSAPDGGQGAASGLFTTITSFGQVLGVVLFETLFSRALPPLARGGHEMLKSVPQASLFMAFSSTYLFGFIVCFISVILSAMLIRKAAV